MLLCIILRINFCFKQYTRIFFIQHVQSFEVERDKGFPFIISRTEEVQSSDVRRLVGFCDASLGKGILWPTHQCCEFLTKLDVFCQMALITSAPAPPQASDAMPQQGRISAALLCSAINLSGVAFACGSSIALESCGA